MKKSCYLIVLLAALLALPLPDCAAQSRLRFDGVGVRGNMMSVVNRFRARGWTVTDAGDHAVNLSGSWSGMDSVTVTVIEDDRGKGVTDLGVMVPCDCNWEDIGWRWESVKRLVSETWGPPVKIRETFDGPEYKMTDADRLVYVKDGRCRYSAEWEARGGVVTATLSFVPYRYCILLRFSIDNGGR